MTSSNGELLSPTTAVPLKTLSVETPRLYIRPLQPKAAEALAKITSTPTITEAVSFLTYPFTTEDAAKLIERNHGDEDCFFGLWVRGTDELIGAIGAHVRPERRLEVGYWMSASASGQGYTSEAFKALVGALHAARPDEQIYAECQPDNKASWRVLTKHDFVSTGRAGARPGRMVLELLQLR